uniref:Uncharacterized protein n=1 Tax=Romanomermis culicivorax TaxID=13658 RepID=A0A915L3U9_ROMCU
MTIASKTFASVINSTEKSSLMLPKMSPIPSMIASLLMPPATPGPFPRLLAQVDISPSYSHCALPANRQQYITALYHMSCWKISFELHFKNGTARRRAGPLFSMNGTSGAARHCVVSRGEAHDIDQTDT